MLLPVFSIRLQVFSTSPVRVFSGHKSDVVDLSWSHSDFLCSASIDHTVMLWHPVRYAAELNIVRCVVYTLGEANRWLVCFLCAPLLPSVGAHR